MSNLALTLQTSELRGKLENEYEHLLNLLYDLCQKDVYSEVENKFIFPEIHSMVYWYSQRLEEIGRELELLTGVKKSKSLLEDIIIE